MPDPIPSLADTAATLFKYARGTDAMSVGVVIPQGDDTAAAIVKFDAIEEVLTVAEGDEIRSVPALDGLGGASLGDLHLHTFPEFEVDLDEGKIVGAIGAMDHLARSVSALAGFFGPGALASAEFRTSGTVPPLEIGATAAGEFMVCCGEVEFELPPGWPSA